MAMITIPDELAAMFTGELLTADVAG